jgi:glycosyltransferase involved in cell wall biosynthesis
MQVLVLTRYSSSGPSSRVRFFQYFPYLASYGVKLQVAPLLEDPYIQSLYAGKRPSGSLVVMAYLNRIFKLVKSKSFDLLWIEKELFPWFPPFAEKLLARLSIPFVVDYDDAVFHRYDLHANPIVRSLLGRSIDTVMHLATSVIVGNDYLAEKARHAMASRIVSLPSVVDLDRYSMQEKTNDQFRIGWIGSPVTAPFIGSIQDALQEAIQKINARLVLVGAGYIDPLPGMEKEILPWSEATEVQNIQSFDVGIMPLPDGPFERGKSGYKIIQYMACGIPVIASPVGVNAHIVEPGKTGFLASSAEEWIQALITLSKNASMRNEFGMAGRKKVEQEYSLQVCAPRLLEILHEAGSR